MMIVGDPVQDSDTSMTQSVIQVLREIMPSQWLIVFLVCISLLVAFLFWRYRKLTWYMANKVIKRSHTPLRRLGLIFIVCALAIYLLTAVHWSLYNYHHFIYRYGYLVKEEIPMPKAIRPGTYWDNYYYEGAEGWRLYDKECINKMRRENQYGLFLSIEKCAIKNVPYPRHYEYEWRQSFSDYWNYPYEIFDIKFRISRIPFLLLLSGFILYFGVIDRIVAWIKSGK